MSPSQLSQLVKLFETDRLAWQQRRLEDEYHVILIDAIHHSIRRGTVEKEAIYVVMGLKKDFSRDILGLYLLPTESASGWKAVLQDLTHRGVQRVGLVLSDELSGIETAVEAMLPHRYHQICLLHKIRELLAAVRHRDKAALASDWNALLGLDQADYRPEQFEKRLSAFIQKWRKKYPSIKNKLPEHKWRYYHAYLHYPVPIRRMVYTTNWIERCNKEIRKITRHVNSFPTPNAALNLVFMVLKRLGDSTYDKPITFFIPYQLFLERLLHDH